MRRKACRQGQPHALIRFTGPKRLDPALHDGKPLSQGRRQLLILDHKADAPAFALDQRPAKVIFQRTHLPGHRRMGHVQHP